ncbi:MAG: cation diffusion facilitator family transporter [Treponema sp.]|nr:cation diffusion facilitator family transporter [Treponema sp.]
MYTDDTQGAVFEQTKTREKIVIRTSIIGIVTNVFLAVFKACIGFMSHSIAIVLDAVNNLSDAASSLITIVGTKLAGREPDRKHPFGYGRIEYLTAMVISLIVLYAGVTSLTESIKKIIHPDVPNYSIVSIILVAVGVIVKVILGRFVKRVGVKTSSDSLVNSGEDATLDAIISASTLLAALLYIWKGIAVESWLGMVISVFIIKAGIEMLRETLSKVLGERAEKDLIQGIKATVRSFKDVSGAYDLVLNNYGPDAFNGSIHIGVPDTYSANDLDDLTRAITHKVYEEHHVILTAIGIYSVNTKNDSSAQLRDAIFALALKHAHVLSLHGFYVNEIEKVIRFDIVISFDAGDRTKVYTEVCEDIKKNYPEYTLHAAMDIDFSET